MIEAAEQIFSEQGIEGASLRAIALAAGSANSFAVQYHFGDREGLIQAIFDRRLAQVEARRRELLDGGEPSAGIRAQLDLICRPLMEQRAASGRHSYAGFLLVLRRSAGGFARRLAVGPKAPLAAAAVANVRAALPPIDDATFEFRVGQFSTLILDALDRLDAGDSPIADPEALLAEIVVLGEAIFSAPSI